MEEKGTDGRIILKYIFKNWDGDMDWIDLASDRGCYKCGNEHLESIKCGEILD